MKGLPLLLVGSVLVTALIWTGYRENDSPELQHVTGRTMGTVTYHVKYMGAPAHLKAQIDHVLVALNQSQSTYIAGSEISRLNEEGELVFESKYFFPVLETSRKVYNETMGAYDPSVGPLVSAWGFGPGKPLPTIDSVAIDSLMKLKGFDQVVFDKEKVALPKGFQLDFGAIAKGYAVDLVAMLLEENGFDNYLVEIGGEVRCSGLNEKQESWSLGIEDPLVARNERGILAVVRLSNQSLATSGNYRNYYERDGEIYAHIIDPRTGHHAQHNLLSASVFADDCISADAYATAFMVLGLEESIAIVEKTDELEAILVYRDEPDALKSYVSEGIRPYVELNRAH